MLGGGARAAWEAMQPRRRKCERCGLYYRESLGKCRWCKDLDDKELVELERRIQAQHRANRSLARIFVVLAALLLVLVLLL